MFLKLGLFSLIFLVLLLPHAQSSRSRFVRSHSHAHHHTPGHHHTSSLSHTRGPLTSSQLKPHIQMVTASNEKHSRYADFGIATVFTVPPQHQVPDDRLGGMLDTPVSGPNPGGNSESLAASNRQISMGGMLDIAVSGPNPGSNSESLLVSDSNVGGSSNTITSMLDTPVSGPSPNGNSNTLGNMLDTPVSGPNPGGNSQGLLVVGVNSRSTNAKGIASKLDNMLDTPVSGPNPGGNSATLGDMLDTPVLGPNPGGNSQILSAVARPSPVGNSQILATSSGPNPGGNSKILAASSLRKDGVSMTSSSLGSNLSKKFVQSGTFRGPRLSKKAEPGTLFDELPKTPVPPSGPSPIHNSAITNQGLFAVRNLKGVFI